MKKSYIDEYNDLVDKKCNEKILAKKNKIKQNVMSSNLVFNKNLNAFITPKLMTEKQFMSSVKNLFKYLGQSIPTEPVLEDLYEKVFNLYSLEQFMEFSDLVEFGGFNSLNEAYNAFLKNNESQEVITINDDLINDDLNERSNNLLEEIESITNEQVLEPLTPTPPTRPRVTQQIQIRNETSPSGVLSSNLVPRQGRPPIVQLPQDIKEQFDFYSSRP